MSAFFIIFLYWVVIPSLSHTYVLMRCIYVYTIDLGAKVQKKMHPCKFFYIFCAFCPFFDGFGLFFILSSLFCLAFSFPRHLSVNPDSFPIHSRRQISIYSVKFAQYFFFELLHSHYLAITDGANLQQIAITRYQINGFCLDC